MGPLCTFVSPFPFSYSVLCISRMMRASLRLLWNHVQDRCWLVRTPLWCRRSRTGWRLIQGEWGFWVKSAELIGRGVAILKWLVCLINFLSKRHAIIRWLSGKLWYSVSPIYRGRVYRGIGYIAVACWTPFFWRPRARYFLRNRGNTFDPIRGRQFFAKSAHRDSLCSRFAGDNFSQNQLWPTCQCGLEHMLCDGQPSSAEHWHLHCIAE